MQKHNLNKGRNHYLLFDRKTVNINKSKFQFFLNFQIVFSELYMELGEA